nr:hypothetical protein [Tanacetum cinerariifolium]
MVFMLGEYLESVEDFIRLMKKCGAQRKLCGVLRIRQRYINKDLGVSESGELFTLACGSTPFPISVNSYVMNGVRFVVHNRDERRTTQNSGICSPGEKDRELYYGQLEEIIEFSMKYHLSLENDMPLRDKIIIALINKPVKTSKHLDIKFVQSEIILFDSSLELIRIDGLICLELEEEKARRRGQEYNWESATYGKIWYDEDVHYLISFEKEFLAIVYNDALTSKPEVSFDFENEYPTIVYNNTLTSEPEVSIDFENEFPAIAYNDASISEPKISAEPTVRIMLNSIKSAKSRANSTQE